MSPSPQPPPPAPAHRDEPVASSPQLNGSPPASSSPAQLAALLTKSLQETESLKAELASAKRRADKAERLLATFQSSQSPSNASPPGSSEGPSSNPHISDAARKAIIDADNRADRAEQERDEAEARLRMLQESWSELDRFLVQMEVRNSDARAQFSRIVAEAGGRIVPVTSIPTQNTVYLPTALQSQLPPIPSTRPHPSTRSRLPPSSQPFPVSLPPPPSASSSRVRPRADSMDTAYNGLLSGPGAPPPAKRPRNDHEPERARYSLSPSNSPHPAHLTNGHYVDHSPPLSVHHANALPALHPHSRYPPYPRHAERDDAAARYPPAGYVEHHRHRRGRSTSRDRDRSSRSRSRSRASSLSLEEMLIEATTTPAEERPGPDGHVRPVHPVQHLHPSARHRSPSPGREREYHLSVPSPHSRSRAHSAVQLHPSAHATGPIASPPGPLPVPGQIQTYQTHIFAPPVTGAPVKKSKLSASGSALSANGSVLTLGPTGSLISGPSTLGGGGFPPTNAQGQRICRQCGLPGRYKDGKCVEKWGPGPEGPGTVCDRCRKKMKRVERRGTLDSQNLAAQMHHAPAAIHPSGAHQAAPGGLTNGRIGGTSNSIHRNDTMHIHPSSQSRALGPSGTHIISSSGSSPQSYARHDRDREYDHPPSPPHSHYSSGSRPAQRSPPTPPYIATLPGSSANDDDAHYDDPPRSRGSRATSREPRAHGHGHAHKSSIASLNGHHSADGSGSSRSASHSPTAKSGGPGASAGGSPRGSGSKSKSSSELMDVDADGEEVDADADADAEADDADADADADPEADADAELLEAVDAAEANHADEEWLKKEDSA
ncbi:hypothetical protein BD413DRAFT_680168 [Trametes elegans]|nr:hypothetical protein BD413DRAFT_680168 [Trametes elegans]